MDSPIPALASQQRNRRILLIRPDRWFCARGETLLESSDEGANWTARGKISIPAQFWLPTRFRLGRRLLRSGIHTVTETADGSLIAVVRKGIVKLLPGETRFKTTFAIREGSRPRNLCRSPDGRLYFGEYFGNSQRREVHIFTSDDGEKWEPAYTFPAKTIRHVHIVRYDPYRKGHWVATGDFDREPKICFTGDAFRTLDVIVEGSQTVRAADLIPTPDAVYYGTDTPLEPNYLMRLDFASGQAQRIHPIEGSSLFAAQAGGWMFFSTAVEPSAVNKSPFIQLWAARKDGTGEPRRIAHWKRDKWDMQLFQFPTLQLPDTERPDELRAFASSAVGVAGRDQMLQIWKW